MRHRNRMFHQALGTVCVLAGVAGMHCSAVANEPEGDLRMVPASVQATPEPELDSSKHRAKKVEAPAPNGDERPWFIRGIRLWEDDGTPCSEPLDVAICTSGIFGRDGAPGCATAGALPREGQNPDYALREDAVTGEFEIKGRGNTVVFAGVQSRILGLGSKHLLGRVGGSDVIPVAGGDARDRLLYCQPRGDVRVQVVGPDGDELDGWWYRVWGNAFSSRSAGESNIVNDVPLGVPLWVNAVRSAESPGLWKQVVLERGVADTVKFEFDPSATTELRGTVVDKATGAPLAPVRLVAELVDGPYGVQAQTLTDSSGQYLLKLSPGIWRIRTMEQVIDGEWQNVLAPGKALGPGIWSFDLTLSRMADGREPRPPALLDH